MFPSNYVGTPQLFRGYPYKTTPSGKRDAVIKQKEIISDHEFSLTRSEWNRIITIYFEVLVEYLLTGRAYKINQWLGSIYLIKTKGIPYKMVNVDNKIVKRRHKNYFLDKYRLMLKWKDQRFSFQSLYRFSLAEKLGAKLYEVMKKDTSVIYNFNNYGRKFNTPG